MGISSCPFLLIVPAPFPVCIVQLLLSDSRPTQVRTQDFLPRFLPHDLRSGPISACFSSRCLRAPWPLTPQIARLCEDWPARYTALARNLSGLISTNNAAAARTVSSPVWLRGPTRAQCQLPPVSNKMPRRIRDLSVHRSTCARPNYSRPQKFATRDIKERFEPSFCRSRQPSAGVTLISLSA